MNKRRNHCIILSKETIRGKFLYGNARTHRYFRKIHTILQKGYFMTSCRIKKNAFTGLVLPLLIIMCFSVKYQMRFIFTESNSISAPTEFFSRGSTALPKMMKTLKETARTIFALSVLFPYGAAEIFALESSSRLHLCVRSFLKPHIILGNRQRPAQTK